MTSGAIASVVRQQGAAMGCELFEVGVFRPETAGTDAGMLLRVWDPCLHASMLLVPRLSVRQVLMGAARQVSVDTLSTFSCLRQLASSVRLL